IKAGNLTVRQVGNTEDIQPFDVTTAMMEDLVLLITEEQGRLTALLKYNAELYEETTMSRMMQHFQILLENVVIHPPCPLSTLPLITQEEQLKLLGEWNTTPGSYAQDTCIQYLFEDQVQKIPDAIAITFQDEQYSYQEVNLRANQIAHHLQKLGVDAETLV